MPKFSRKKEDGHIDETWLIPYADMLTLLLALFVILFAMSSVDAQKFERLSQTLSAAFSGGDFLLDHTSPVPPVRIPQDESVGDAETPEDLEDEIRRLQEMLENMEEGEDRSEIEDELSELEIIQRIINAYIRDNNLEMSLSTELTEDGLMITILENALFDSGSANLRPDAMGLAVEISNLLDTDPPRHITIAGHTDNVPISTANFANNWELSSARALNFMYILLENENLEPYRMSATAYGEYRPVATNDTPEGRQQNRRVEVLILPRYQISD